MTSVLVSDWITVNANASGTGSTNPGVISVTQDAEAWSELGDEVDGTFNVDMRNVVNPTNGTVTLNLETGPSRDESLMFPVCSPLVIGSQYASVGQGANTIVQQTFLSQTGSTLLNSPLARFLRWRLSVPASSSGPWSATFRIRMTGTPFPYFSPLYLPAALPKLFLRGDQGISLGTTTTLSSWSDQSGLGNNFNNNSTLPTFSPNGLNGLPTPQTSANGYLKYSGSGQTINNGNSMFLVVQQTTLNNNVQTIIDGTAGVGNFQTVSQTAMAGTTLNLNATMSVNVTLGTSLGTPCVLQIDWNGANTQVYQNGTAQGAVVNPGANNLVLGTIGIGSGGNNFVGNIAEVILFASLLSANNRTRVTRYLGGRYGIAVP